MSHIDLHVEKGEFLPLLHASHYVKIRIVSLPDMVFEIENRSGLSKLPLIFEIFIMFWPKSLNSFITNKAKTDKTCLILDLIIYLQVRFLVLNQYKINRNQSKKKQLNSFYLIIFQYKILTIKIQKFKS